MSENGQQRQSYQRYDGASGTYQDNSTPNSSGPLKSRAAQIGALVGVFVIAFAFGYASTSLHTLDAASFTCGVIQKKLGDDLKKESAPEIDSNGEIKLFDEFIFALLSSPVFTDAKLLKAVTDALYIRGYANRYNDVQEGFEELLRTDKITTVLVGTSSPVGNNVQTCTAVFVNGKFLLFDVGDGSVQSMNQGSSENNNGNPLPLRELDAVFLTHYHNDHFADLGEVMELSWSQGRPKVLPVYGPTGLVDIVDAVNKAYVLDRSYRIAHHGEELLSPTVAPIVANEFELPSDDNGVTVFEEDGVIVKTFRVNHEPVTPAVGYRIEYAGHAIVISGDTIRTNSLLENSRGADLLVSEVMNMEVIELMEQGALGVGDTRSATFLFDIRDYHIDVTDVGEVAQEAGVERLVLTHLAPFPSTDVLRRRWFEQPIRRVYDGAVLVAENGEQVVIDV